jgi:hypothetical protein
LHAIAGVRAEKENRRHVRTVTRLGRFVFEIAQFEIGADQSRACDMERNTVNGAFWLSHAGRRSALDDGNLFEGNNCLMQELDAVGGRGRSEGRLRLFTHVDAPRCLFC